MNHGTKEKHTISVAENIGPFTSFHDYVIEATKDHLTKCFGIQPVELNNEKVKYQWEFKLDNRWGFTVYDWKNCNSEHGKIKWHIGWKDESFTDDVLNVDYLIEALKDIGLEVKKESFGKLNCQSKVSI